MSFGASMMLIAVASLVSRAAACPNVISHGLSTPQISALASMCTLSISFCITFLMQDRFRFRTKIRPSIDRLAEVLDPVNDILKRKDAITNIEHFYLMAKYHVDVEFRDRQRGKISSKDWYSVDHGLHFLFYILGLFEADKIVVTALLPILCIIEYCSIGSIVNGYKDSDIINNPLYSASVLTIFLLSIVFPAISITLTSITARIFRFVVASFIGEIANRARRVSLNPDNLE